MEKDNQQRKKFKRLLFLILAVILVATSLFLINNSGTEVSDKSISKSISEYSYQAVFLSNGQVYFGKMSVSPSWIRLTDVYYLQATQSLQATSNNQINSPKSNPKDIQLVKLGSELHGPKDTMFLERNNILFWENMKDDSRVVQAIQQYNQLNK